jgi:hypothetical protein
VDGGLFLNPARLANARAGLHVPSYHVHTFYYHPILFGEAALNSTGLAFFFAGYHQHIIACTDPH